MGGGGGEGGRGWGGEGRGHCVRERGEGEGSNRGQVWRDIGDYGRVGWRKGAVDLNAGEGGGEGGRDGGGGGGVYRGRVWGVSGLEPDNVKKAQTQAKCRMM